MTNATIAYAEPVLVAIDIAKARHEVLISVPGRTRRRRLTVLNQLDDFNRLITTLSDYQLPPSSRSSLDPKPPAPRREGICARRVPAR